MVPKGLTLAPAVPEPPAGYDVVGSVAGGVVTADNLDVESYDLGADDPTTRGAGNPVVHRMRWDAQDGGGLAVLTVPSRLASLDALSGYVALGNTGEIRRIRPMRVGGHSAVLLEDTVRNSPQPGPYERVLYTQEPWGNLVVVVAWGESLPTEPELAAVTTSLRTTTEAAWPRRLAPPPPSVQVGP